MIQCQEDQKLIDIFNNFSKKVKIDENCIYYFYDGHSISPNEKGKTFLEIANSLDKERKKMNVLVYENTNEDNDNNQEKRIIKSKNIICPKCNESINMKMDNYKINLFGCKNNHTFNNLSMDEFEKSQMIDLKNIKCGKCNEMKSNTYKNGLYRCYECQINLCPLCKEKHNKDHNIIDYDRKNYECNKHKENYSDYCIKCEKDICFSCDEEHEGHEIISLKKKILNKNELIQKLENLKNSMIIFINDYDKIIRIINNVKENFENYYKLVDHIFNNYNKNERNYEIFNNVNELINYNNKVIIDINSIINNKNLDEKFVNILNIYNKINNITKIEKFNKRDETKNELNIKVQINYEDINKKIN